MRAQVKRAERERRRTLLQTPVEQLPTWMLRELAACPCVCPVIKPERRPCTSCRARPMVEAASTPERP